VDRAAEGPLVGFRALGRQGELGVVVREEPSFEGRSESIVVQGGASQALTYFVPPARLRTVSPERRTVVLDVDLSEFVPRLHDDGTVELRLTT
jgi:hypothetical protein